MAVGFLEGIFNPERLRVEEYQKKKETIGPYQQLMAQQYLQENPEADFSGVSGYEAIQARFEGKRRAQAPLGPMEKREEAEKKTVRPGATGFTGVSRGGSLKENIFLQIQDKKQAGTPLTNIEKKFEKKFLGISDSKGDLTIGDRVKIRKVATDMASADRIAAGATQGLDDKPSEQEISDNMLAAAQQMRPGLELEQLMEFVGSTTPEEAVKKTAVGIPKMTKEQAKKAREETKGIVHPWEETKAVTKEGKEVNLGIKLPEIIKKSSQALKFLTEQGMGEDEATEWLRVRMK